MKRLKEQILEEHQQPTSSSTCDPTSSTCDLTPSTSSSTCDPTPSTSSHATRSYDTYVYGVGILAVLAIGVCVFFAYPKNKNSSMKKRINHQNDVIYFRKIYNAWVVLIGKKNIEDSLKDGLIITIRAAGIFFALKVVNVKPPKASLDAMDLLKLTGGVCSGALVKDYAVYKKRINEWIQQQKILQPFIGS